LDGFVLVDLVSYSDYFYLWFINYDNLGAGFFFSIFLFDLVFFLFKVFLFVSLKLL
jgi:hypothetical protein